MLPELILALNGHPGNILSGEGDEDGTKIVCDFPFINLAERGMIDRICTLASHYKKLRDFLELHGQTPIQPVNRPTASRRIQGIYIIAFCHGLNDVMIPYKKTLVGLESQLLNDPGLTIAQIQSCVECYQLLFAALSAVIDQITISQLSGCDVLELVHKATSCGIPDVKDAFKYILRSCHEVVYKQLTAWMLNGLLIDQFSECFICSVHQNSTGSTLKNSVPDFEEAISDKKSTHNLHYQVNSEKLPYYIPLRIAEKILFIGESVRMFEIQTKNEHSKLARSILRDKETEFSTNINKLSTRMSFDIMIFEEVIDGVRLYAAERLWQLLVSETDLASQLRVMKVKPFLFLFCEYYNCIKNRNSLVRNIILC